MTTATTHTQAPWLLGYGLTRIEVFEESGKIVAVIPRDDVHGRPYLETNANAKLIAAAPKLYAALECALKALTEIAAEMSVGDRFTNAGQSLLDALPVCSAALEKVKDAA